MNENIDLCDILKDCPENTEFYCSEIDDNVKFSGIHDDINDGIHFVAKSGYNIIGTDFRYYFICTNRYGSIFSKGKTPIIFPSKYQRDWSKWQCPKPKFDPKTLKPFESVLVKSEGHKWTCTFVSHVDKDGVRIYLITLDYVYYAIPYNDDTKHLVGTTEEAPEYYRYWEATILGKHL